MTKNERIEMIGKAFAKGFDVEVKYIESVPVVETFQNQMVWDGLVDVFDVVGHGTAKRGYGWIIQNANNEIDYATVLEIAPVNSPKTAVQSWLVSEGKK